MSQRGDGQKRGHVKHKTSPTDKQGLTRVPDTATVVRVTGVRGRTGPQPTTSISTLGAPTTRLGVGRHTGKTTREKRPTVVDTRRDGAVTGRPIKPGEGRTKETTTPKASLCGRGGPGHVVGTSYGSPPPCARTRDTPRPSPTVGDSPEGTQNTVHGGHQTGMGGGTQVRGLQSDCVRTGDVCRTEDGP